MNEWPIPINSHAFEKKKENYQKISIGHSFINIYFIDTNLWIVVVNTHWQSNKFKF